MTLNESAILGLFNAEIDEADTSATARAVVSSGISGGGGESRGLAAGPASPPALARLRVAPTFRCLVSECLGTFYDNQEHSDLPELLKLLSRSLGVFLLIRGCFS